MLEKGNRGQGSMGDPKLIYSLEIRLLDLEKKIDSLEKQVDALTTGRKTQAGAGRQFRLMTQRELGERSGIRPNHISAIERGMSYGLKTAKRLSGALEVQVDLLLDQG